jgi:hypothetical protein
MRAAGGCPRRLAVQWFVCEEADESTRCFIIQGSDSVASWKANRLFKPTTFEYTSILVHPSIYEDAKGIYAADASDCGAREGAQGERASPVQGQSLGVSLALLVSLMLVRSRSSPW